MSNAAKAVGYVVVDRANGGSHVGEPHRSRRAAEGAALRANVDAGTAARFEAKQIY